MLLAGKLTTLLIDTGLNPKPIVFNNWNWLEISCVLMTESITEMFKAMIETFAKERPSERRVINLLRWQHANLAVLQFVP